MESKDTNTRENNATEQELFTLTEEMRIAMLEAGKKASQIPVEYHVKEEIPYNFRDYDQTQSFFVIVTKQGFIEESHPVVLLDAIIERLDLTTVYKVYAKEGCPPYHPRMMLKILFYAYFSKIMSSRTIWNNVLTRSDFIFLAAGQVPNFRTINNFRKRHLAQLPDIFAQIVMYCRELNMIGYEHLAIDGEKIQANANYTKSKNLEQIGKEFDRLKNGLKKLLETEINEYVPEAKKEKRINTLEKKIEKLEPLQKQLEQIADRKKRINLTDPDAPVMRLKDGRSRPSYNHQTARDDKCGVVTALETCLSGDKSDDLLPLVDQSVRNSGRHHDEVSADSGFGSYNNLEKVEDRPGNIYETAGAYRIYSWG
jgi:transposase